MKHGTVSAGIFTYAKSHCNAYGCNAHSYRGLLCREHWETYATTDALVELLTNIEEVNFGSPSPELARLVASNHRMHNITGQPMPYVEHFPLESLFHAYRKSIAPVQSMSRQDAVLFLAKKVKSLISDFGWQRNEWLAELRLQYAELTGDFSTLYHADTSIATRAEAFFPMRAERLWAYASGLFFMLAVVKLAPPLSEFGFFTPLDLSLLELLAFHFSFVGIVVFGLFSLQRLDLVGHAAGRHKLYADPQPSRTAVITFAKIRARFDKRSDLDYGTMGRSVMLTLIAAIGLGWNRWTWSPTVCAVIAQLLLLSPCIYSALMIYNVYANASVALSELPPLRFVVDKKSADGRHGVADIADLILFILIFNLTFLLFISFVIPLMFVRGYGWLLAWFLITSPLLHFRLMQVRKAWRLRGALIESVDAALRSAQSPTYGSQRPAGSTGFLFLLLSRAARKRLEFLAATLIIPLLLMVGDKFSKDAVAWIAALIS